MKNQTWPDRKTADATLQWASDSNPGAWVDHSRHVANAAEAIGRAAGLDGEKCYVLGLLHDIGRYPGRSYARHMLEGYRLCMDKGWTDAARICLTHSFPIPEAEVFIGWHDVTAEEKTFVARFIQRPFDDYDQLIQLCDALATSGGCCTLEKRWIDVLMRYGWSEHNPAKWRETLAVKRKFDALAGCNIYDLLPGVAENSLKNLPY